MKQFAQCTNCQQWYIRTATSPVEIYQGNQLHCIAIWCAGCIAAAEQRSVGDLHRPASPVLQYSQDEQSLPQAFQQFVAEHLSLMDRALHDDEDVLVPVIKDFIARGSLCQAQLESPEQRQRLTGQVHYWETFLKALNAPDRQIKIEHTKTPVGFVKKKKQP